LPTPEPVEQTASLPAWARIAGAGAASIGAGKQGFDAAFSAGVCLAFLDQALRSGADASEAGEPSFAGALRQRLALRAAGRCASILRLREDEGALRDAEHLAPVRAQMQTSPAGRVHRLWRSFASRPFRIDPPSIRVAADFLDLPQNIDCAALAALLRDAGGKEQNPLSAAGSAGSTALSLLSGAPRIEAELFAYWISDFLLAKRFGWDKPFPLLATAISHASLRRTISRDGDGDCGRDGRRRPRPDDADWLISCARAYALAAQDSYALFFDLSRRSKKLLAVAPKLRAKASGRVIELLLADDAVSPARAAKSAGLSDRAARRLFDRLVELGAVRELSGRTNFRLYGL
jgi:hypothetical protein